MPNKPSMGKALRPGSLETPWDYNDSVIPDPEHSDFSPMRTAVIQSLNKDGGAGEDGTEYHPVLKEITAKARAIFKAIDIELNIRPLIDQGMDYYEDADAQLTKEFTQKDLDNFDKLTDIVPNLYHLLRHLRTPKWMHMYKQIIEMIDKQARGSMSEDVSTSKRNGPEWGLVDPTNPWNPTIPSGGDKTVRGTNHDGMGALVIPISKVGDWNHRDKVRREKIRSDLESGLLSSSKKDPPTFLYPEGHRYNPKKKTEGLLRGPILLRFYRGLQTGPSTAAGGNPTSNRKSKGQLSGCTKPQATDIAYAAVMAAYALTSAKSFSIATKADGIRFFRLYRWVRAWLETDSAWANETLAYFAGEVPHLNRPGPTRRVVVISDSEDDNDEDTILSEIRASSKSRSGTASSDDGAARRGKRAASQAVNGAEEEEEEDDDGPPPKKRRGCSRARSAD
ncbi:hypothetical protein BKA70DRAFT_1243802 [Coprinopsis sp. MPI-PUGE-AT-0042]|nr:hypothetical protein BKA70DRAFT_1243802 [Coprinopsis sp. MPI-PUGE-AT-0042]